MFKMFKEKRTREVLDLLNDSLGNLIFEKDTNGQIDRKMSHFVKAVSWV